MATRASDAEREKCARSLRDHAAAGRLEVSELEERLGRAYGARYRSELRALLRDLPRDHGRRLAAAADRIDRFVLKLHAWSYAVFNGSLVGVWAVSGQGDFWPAFTIAPWGVVLAWHAGGSWSVRRMLHRGSSRRRLTA
ncbi:MAG TPA: DUF1707 domain-containing protein [Solirubrobacteraceae bacterium]|nr:DUF1707 domain-containing protein [Solirubrobacteraceae bacterium]